MAWPVEFDEDRSPDAVILVPSAAARVQDLGWFLTGRLMETDIVEHSALVARSDAAGNPLVTEGRVRFAFEGNVYNAVNLKRFAERCQCAAGRLRGRYPSISYGSARVEELTPVASMDLDRMVITEVIDKDLLEVWSGEPIESICPARVPTPCTDPAMYRPLLEGLVSPMMASLETGYLARTINGQIFYQKDFGAPLTLWSPEDTEFREMIGKIGMPDVDLIRIFGQSWWEDPLEPEETGSTPGPA